MMSGQRKNIAVKNTRHPGKMFGLASAHKDHQNSPVIKMESFLLGKLCTKTRQPDLA